MHVVQGSVLLDATCQRSSAPSGRVAARCRCDPLARRKDIITSARGQSQPVDRLVLKNTTPMFLSASMARRVNFTDSMPANVKIAGVVQGVGHFAFVQAPTDGSLE